MESKLFNKKRKIRKEIADNFGQSSDKPRTINLINTYYKFNKKGNLLLNEKTWIDLQMDDVFGFVDRTFSKTGQQVLYDKLHRIHTEKELNDFNLKVEYYEKNDDKKMENLFFLHQYENSCSYDLPDIFFNKINSTIPKWILSLSLLSVILLLLSFFYSQFMLPFISVAVINTILHYYFKRNINFHYSIFKNISVFHTYYVKLLHNDNETEILAADEKKKLHSISKKSFYLTLNIDNVDDFSAILFYIIEIVKGVLLFDAIQFNRTINLINKNSKILLKVSEFIGTIDSAISVASLKAGCKNCTEPVFITDKEIVMADIYHPLIKDCKKNSIETHNNVIITGANMTGKTTFLKAVGINVLLAQTINFAFCRECKIPKMNIFSSIQNEDNLTDGVSFFMDELLRTKQIVDSVNNSEYTHLILIDEIYRGTNSEDRIALASSVLNYLTRDNCMVFVTTHDLDIITFTGSNYEKYYFDYSLDKNKIVFDYSIQKGIRRKSNVIELIKVLDFPKQIIDNTILK